MLYTCIRNTKDDKDMNDIDENIKAATNANTKIKIGGAGIDCLTK